MAKKKKIDWSNSSWSSAKDLAGKIAWEGGLAEFVTGYGASGLPEPLQSAADNLAKAYKECEKVFEDAGVF